MGGKNYERKSGEAEQRERWARSQARTDYLRLRMDKLGLSEEQRRELATYALDHQIPLGVLLHELERRRCS